MGDIYLFTGSGGGKTTNALGLALRSMGHGHKVIIIQFMKWWKQTGEYKIGKKFPLYEIYQFGRKGWIGLDNLTDEDRELAKKAIEFTEEIVDEKRPKLLVLDELNLAVYCKLIPIADVTGLLSRMRKYKDMTIVITGRNAPKELEDIADYVNVIDVKKIPEKTVSTKGIQW